MTERISALNPLFDEIQELVLAAQNGGLSPGQAERLECLVCENAAARRLYAKYVMETASLRVWAASESTECEEQILGREQDGLDFSVQSGMPTLVVPTVSRTMSGASVNNWLVSYFAASVILCIALLGGWAYKITHNDSHIVSQQNQSGIEKPQPEFVGRITGMADCRWADPDTRPYAGSYVPLGRKYELTSGLLEITYTSGARVILEGPCEYKVDSTTGGYLALGKLTARVEKKVAGGQWLVASAKPQAATPQPPAPSPQSPAPLFSVTTPTAVVTDLGTEFGVEVTPDGSTETHVFEGIVHVIATTKGAKNHPLICRFGESAQVKPDESGLRAIIFDSNAAERFVRSMPSPADRNRAYADYVLSLDPAVYYRMEMPKSEKEQRVVYDSASGGRHGKLLLSDEYGGSPYRPGRFGDSLCFRGPEKPDRAVVHDYLKATDDRLTISAWVMAAGRPGWAQIANNWSGMGEDQSYEGQFQLALYRQDGDLCARVRQRNGDVVEVREREPIPLFKWQHVALVLDGEMVRLYRNGREVDRRECIGVLPDPPVSGLGIGCRLNPASTDAVEGSAPGYDYWQGRIDELAVFNEALSEKTIRELYEAKRLTDTLGGQ